MQLYEASISSTKACLSTSGTDHLDVQLKIARDGYLGLCWRIPSKILLSARWPAWHLYLVTKCHCFWKTFGLGLTYTPVIFSDEWFSTEREEEVTNQKNNKQTILMHFNESPKQSVLANSDRYLFMLQRNPIPLLSLEHMHRHVQGGRAKSALFDDQSAQLLLGQKKVYNNYFCI